MITLQETTCTRRIQFCAGHRIVGHESKCAHLHGHNYVALITARAPLDDIGRVIDFSVLKERVGGWIEKNWDHGFILHDIDLAGLAAVKAFNNSSNFCQRQPRQKLFTLLCNPTAENLARYLCETVCPEQLEGTGVEVIKVKLWETENCYATFERIKG